MQLSSKILLAFMFLIIVVARIKSIHLTEGEALIAYWHYWFTAITCVVIAAANELRY